MKPALLPVVVGATIVIDASVDADAGAESRTADYQSPRFGSCQIPFPTCSGTPQYTTRHVNHSLSRVN